MQTVTVAGERHPATDVSGVRPTLSRTGTSQTAVGRLDTTPSTGRPLRLWLWAPVLFIVAAVWGVSAQDVTLPGHPDSLKFAVMSDIHATGDRPQYEVARQMAAVHARFPFEMVMMIGDNLSGAHNPRDVLDKFANPFGPLLNAGVRFYAALGNHDDQTYLSYKLWNMGGARYYTFTRNRVQFFVLDSNRLDPPQVAWITDALKNSQADWRICYLHHPLYSDGSTHGSQDRVRAVVEPIFVQYGVNVVLSGHDHIYERIKPQKGIVYFVTGGAGPVRKGNTKPSEMTAAYFDQDRSFMIAEIQGDDLFFQAISRTGKSVDSGVIHRRPTM
jgi:predicted phosphodiesterase